MKTPPPVVVEGGGSPGVAGVCSSYPSPRAKFPDSQPLTQGDWQVSRETFSVGLFLGRVSGRFPWLYSRQDCDDLIALLTRVRERLP